MTARRVWIRFAFAVALACATAVAYSGVRLRAAQGAVSFVLADVRSGEGDQISINVTATTGAALVARYDVTATSQNRNRRNLNASNLPQGIQLLQSDPLSGPVVAQLQGTLARDSGLKDPLNNSNYLGSEGVYTVAVTAFDAGGVNLGSAQFSWDISRFTTGDVFVGGGNSVYQVYGEDGTWKFDVHMPEEHTGSEYEGSTTGCASNWESGEVWVTNYDDVLPGVNVITRQADSGNDGVLPGPGGRISTFSSPYTDPSRRVSTIRNWNQSSRPVDVRPQSIAFDKWQNMYVGHSFGAVDNNGLPLDADGKPVMDAAQRTIIVDALGTPIVISADIVDEFGNPLDVDSANDPYGTMGAITAEIQPSPMGVYELWSYTARRLFLINPRDPDGNALAGLTDANGRVLLREQYGRDIHVYSKASGLNSYNTPTNTFLPVTYGARGPAAMDLESDQQTILYSAHSPYVYRYKLDRDQNGTLSGTASQLPVVGNSSLPYSDSNPPRPILSGLEPTFDVRMLPPGDGTGGYLVVHFNEIDRVDANGVVVQTYRIDDDSDYPYPRDLLRNDVCQVDPSDGVLKPYHLESNGALFTAGDLDTAATPADCVDYAVGEPVQLGTYPESARNHVYEWFSLAVAPDGRTFWAATRYDVFHFDIASGKRYGKKIHATDSILHSNSELAGLCVVQEYRAANPFPKCPIKNDLGQCVAADICKVDLSDNVLKAYLADGITIDPAPGASDACTPVLTDLATSFLQAQSDGYPINQGQTLSENILVNDTSLDPNFPVTGATAIEMTGGNWSSWESDPAHFSQAANGQLVFTPDPDLARPLPYTLSYIYRATDSAGNLSNKATVTITVNKRIVDVAVAVGSPVFTYDGSTHGTTCAVTDPLDGSWVPDPTKVSLTYALPANGQSRTPPVNAGTYTVTCSFPGDDFHSSRTASGTITILPATPIATASGGTFTYNGQPHAGGCTVAGVSPDVLTGTIAYNPGSGAPVNAGTYTVSCDFAGNSNYTAAVTSTATIAVNKAHLTVTAADTRKTYGAANPAVTAAITGFVNGETVAVVSGAAACTTSGAAGPNVGTYAGANACTQGTLAASNYDFPTYVTGALEITAAHLTVTAADTSKTYGTANPAVTAAITGFANGETVAVVSGAAACTTSGAAGPNVGVYAGANSCTQGTLSAANYDFPNYVTGTLAITAASSVTTVICTGSPTYSGLAQTPCTATVTGVGGLSEALIPTYANNVNAGTGTATASASYPGDLNHTGSTDTQTFSIAKAPVTATAGGGTATYDGSVKTPAACVVTGAYTGDLVCANSPASVGPAAGTTSISPATSGTGLSNFDVTPISGSYTIDKKQATATAPDAHAIYNGSAVAGPGTCSDSLTPAIAYTPGTGAPVNAGTTSYTVTCGDGGQNYLTGTAAGSIVIDKAPVTATAGGGTATYDGSVKTPAACVVTGAYTGDLVCANSPASVGPAAGTTSISPATSGTGLGNFDVTTISGSYTIDKKQATATAPDAHAIYSGSAVVGAGTCSDGLTPVIAYTPGPGAPVNAGTTSYAVTCGDGGQNYLTGTATGSIVIDRATATATAGGGSFVYDGSTHAPASCAITPAGTELTCTNSVTSIGPGVTASTVVTPVVAGNTPDNYAVTQVNATIEITKASSTTSVICTGTPMYSGLAQTPCTATVTGAGALNLTLTPSYANNVNAGTDTATASASYPGDLNHTGSADTKTFSIAKAPVTATAGGGTATYDGSVKTPAACVVTGAYTGDLVCANSPASVGPAAGTTSISPATSGTGLSNFDVTPIPGAYTIDKKPSQAFAPAVATTYSGSPVFGPGSCSDGLSPAITYSGGGAPVVAGSTNYTVACGNDNYLASTATGPIVIAKATPTATATGGSFTYNGSSHAGTCAVVGVGTDVLTGTISYSSSGAPVASGSYTVTCTFAGNLNYGPATGTATITIAKAAATVTAGGGSKVYGTADPAITASPTGFVTADGITVSATRATGEAVGTYVTTATATGDLANYDVSYVTGTFSITKAALSVTVADKTRAYLDPNPPLTGTLTGVVAGDGITASYSTTAVASSLPGTYPITATLADPNGKLGNYNVTNTPGTLTITQATLVCSAAKANPSVLWPPNHKMVAISIRGVTDADGEPATIRVTSIFQDEPTNTNGDGDTGIDGSGIGTSRAYVRAERVGDRSGENDDREGSHHPGDRCDHERGRNGHKAGDGCEHERDQDTGNGRVYHIRFTATAGSLSCDGDVTVGVPHDQGQHDAAIDDGPLYDSTTESFPAGHHRDDGCRNDNHDEGKPDHFDGDKCDHELGKNGHKKGDGCDHDRMKKKDSELVP